MKKYLRVKSLLYSITASAVFVFLIAGSVWAASTIGNNMSTTGTFTSTVTSATAAAFQDAAGTFNVLVVDTSNRRVGVGAAPQTVFEVQGTSSASYFLTGNTIQVGGFASVAYNRFGTAATTHSLSATNDVLINGQLEVDGQTFFDANASAADSFELTNANSLLGINAGGKTDTMFEVGGTASISGIITLANGQIRPLRDSATAFRFQNASGANSALTISTGNSWVGVGATPQTTFEVQGTSSASYLLSSNTLQIGGFASVAYNRFGTAATTHSLSATNDVLINGNLEVDTATFLDGLASISSNLEVVGYASASKGFFTTDLIVGSNVASSSTAYTAEFGTPTVGSAGFLFANGANSASTTGTCFQLKDTAGKWIYMRFNSGATTPTLSTIKCHAP